MAKLIRYEKEMSLEEYVIAEVCANYGTQTRVTASYLKKMLDACKVSYKKGATKEDMIRKLYEHYQDWEIVARELAVGVKVNQYVAAFPFVKNADIKRLEKFEVLRVVGYQEFRAYGQYKYAPIYDLVQFMNMSEEEMRGYLEEYPKGKRKKACGSLTG